MIYSLIFVSFFVVTPTLVISSESDSLTQKNVTEALHIIGKFLKDEGGTNWLAGLVTKQTAPLRTEDLMNEILNATRANEIVKQAANTVKLALDEQNHNGTNKTLVLEFDGWKEMIDSVDNETDIICLYRKSYNVSSERSDDWQKFLNNISPDYMIYLALDMGQKYVICLKKINVPEQNISARNLDDAVTHTSSTIAESQTASLTIPSSNEVTVSSRSLVPNDKLMINGNDKCDASDTQLDIDHNLQNKVPNLNSVRRTLPTPNVQNSDSNCNRPIIFMLPPNYMSPMGGYNWPSWPRTGFQLPSNSLPTMPYYQSRYIPNPRIPQSRPYSPTADRYRQMYNYGKKQQFSTVTPRTPSPRQSQNNRNQMNLKQYFRSVLPNSAENSPKQNVRGQFPIPHYSTASYSKPPISPLSRSFQRPTPATLHQYPPPNYKHQHNLYPHMLPIQPNVAYTRPSHAHPPSNIVPSYLSKLSPQNCITCASPCDRPILLKVLVETPENHPVKVSLMPNEKTESERK